MLHQPFTYILIANIILILTFKFNNVFKVVAIIYPICVSLSLLASNDMIIFEIYGIEFAMDYHYNTKQVGYSFLIAGLTVNLYLLGQKRKFEVIIGGFYLAFSMMCLFADDLISMFVSLELMMICATTLIFLGGNKDSAIASKQYFLTHIFSSTLILIGIGYFIHLNGGANISNLSNTLFETRQFSFMYGCILLGCVINIAAFPFSSWMINCYSESTTAGFLYLTSFTTKVSVMIILKLFSGFEILKYFGIIMMLYGGIYACIENNLRRLFCYLSIAQMGFTLTIISTGHELAIKSAIFCLAIDIIYKLIFGLYNATLNDYLNIRDARQICKTDSFTINFALLIGFLMMINFPLTTSFICKTWVIITDIDILYSQKFLSFIILIALPLKQFIQNKNCSHISINKTCLSSLLIPSIVLIIFNIYLLYSYVSSNKLADETLSSENLIVQSVIIVIGVISALMLNLPRIDTRKFNFDLLVFFSGYGSNLIKIYKEYKNTPKEKFELDLAENKILKSFSIIHTQPTAISIIFIMLIILILTQLKG